jgi:hypothetical protein
VVTEAVDRHNARVFQAAGDLGFEQKSRSSIWIISVSVLDFLERHLPVQILILSNKYLPKSALSMRAQNTKAWCWRRRCLNVGSERISVRRACLSEMAQTGLYIGIGNPLQVFSKRCNRTQRSQTHGWVVAVCREMSIDERLQ